jgi:hypothetical protein
MPGYGIVGPDEGSGLLPWSWAEERLAASLDYWVATVWPDGRPHVVPVWGIWHDRALVFSCSRASRKARNLAHDPRCVVTTADPLEPVIVEGVAAPLTDETAITRFAAAINDKHRVEYPVDFYTSADNACFRVEARSAIGLAESDFTGSPTRWEL